MEKSLQKYSSEIELGSPPRASDHNGSNTSLNCSSGIPSPPKVISCDESNKGCQTIETAFVPCEACDVVQKKMRESGDMIVDICQRQLLPSSLRNYR
jgi:hypothetical protein